MPQAIVLENEISAKNLHMIMCEMLYTVQKSRLTDNIDLYFKNNIEQMQTTWKPEMWTEENQNILAKLQNRLIMFVYLVQCINNEA